ncbi:TerB family tellurite resistance protein [Aliiglaciecola sp. CAU 1673]|uniref:tellurite resistance TerB family protein n=1 Tax=Aliiglaciecola sp. CAU 1673 TaxID=3032595 RepID=UPI0023DC8637|nr:TerB family tellurite resistance protein [Aliiglaciecola sp. CAU 1673]MDF2177170.1 TerB family tellurite resistance protein [Aliiglaciecola sp. CAU 1673]
MIKAFSRWIQENLAQPATTDQQQRLDLAAAVLYCEIVRADNVLAEEERSMMVKLLKQQFALSTEQADTLVTQSSEKAEHSADLVSFTRQINAKCDVPQKIRILENLWHLAFADNHLDAHEEHLIRRIADLLHLPHSQFIKAKLEAKPEAKSSE